jgi:hypothetical protein
MDLTPVSQNQSFHDRPIKKCVDDKTGKTAGMHLQGHEAEGKAQAEHPTPVSVTAGARMWGSCGNDRGNSDSDVSMDKNLTQYSLMLQGSRKLPAIPISDGNVTQSSVDNKYTLPKPPFAVGKINKHSDTFERQGSFLHGNTRLLDMEVSSEERRSLHELPGPDVANALLTCRLAEEKANVVDRKEAEEQRFAETVQDRDNRALDTQRLVAAELYARHISDPLIQGARHVPIDTPQRQLMPDIESQLHQMRAMMAEMQMQMKVSQSDRRLQDSLQVNPPSLYHTSDLPTPTPYQTHNTTISKQIAHTQSSDSTDSNCSDDLFVSPANKHHRCASRIPKLKPVEISTQPKIEARELHPSAKVKISQRNVSVPSNNKADRLRVSCSDLRGKGETVEKARDRSPSARRERRDFIKLDRYDGSTPLETFLVHLNTCTDYNGWTEKEKFAQLKAALRGSAAQVLMGDDGPITLESLLCDLQDNFGTKGLEPQYESALSVRRRQKGESLRALYQDIHRLVMLAYPGERGRLRDKLGTEAFINGLNDNDLSLKVRNLCPTDLQTAYKTALMLESNQLIVNRHDDTRETRKRDVRHDVQARAVTEEFEGKLSEKFDHLENKFLSRSAAVLKEVEDSAGGNKLTLQVEKLQQMVAELEARLVNKEKDKSAPSEQFQDTKSGFSGKVGQQAVVCFSCGSPDHKSPHCPLKNKGRAVQKEHFNDKSCWNCGGAHLRRHCPHPKIDKDNKGGPCCKGSFGTMKIACGMQEASEEHNVYLDIIVNGMRRSFLFDSGCDLTLVPSSFVRGKWLEDTSKVIYAANGAEIILRGQTTVDLKIGNLVIPTEVLVSDNISEGMIGYDFLSSNDCYWGFRTGQIMIRGQVFAMKPCNNVILSCCRVVAQEKVVVPPRHEMIVSGRAVFDQVRGEDTGNLVEFATRPREMRNGLYVASTVIPHQCANIPVRLLNTSGRDVTLCRGATLSDLEPVAVVPDEIEPEVTPLNIDSAWKDGLVNDLSEEIDPGTRHEISCILDDYADCFSKSEFDLGRTTFVKHSIDTGDHRPISQALRRQPIQYLPEIDRQLEELSRQGIIEPAASPWASNLVIVAKKDKSLRMCVDYRGLNNFTKKDSYPLPRINECLDSLGNATFFSTFDLRSGYFQIAMEETDKDKTAFLTRRGSFRYTSLPFGLCNAPATFQRLMDTVLAGLKYEICLVYLDDIILFSHSVEEHLVRFRMLLDRLRLANLKLKPSKCHLLKREVNFLGHVISAGQVATDPEKVVQVATWPTPKNVTELRSFIGLVSYYRKFCKNFSSVAAPLHAMTGKNARFNWTKECDKAFQDLKARLISSPILAMPADKGEYCLDTDASNLSIGAVLSQVQNGEERVIAYASRTLNAAERNYCVTRKELLAVVFYAKQFRNYLLGREFLLRTDHSALRWLRHTPEPIGQQARWLEQLEAFNFRIEHRPGRKHGNADALSRRPCRQCHQVEEIEDAEAVASVCKAVTKKTREFTNARMLQFGGKGSEDG